MIDYHCHILPGLDDGCQNEEESIDMARQLVDAGFSRAYCTPHCITGLYDFSAEQVREAVTALQQVLDSEGIPFQLETGMEYYLDDFFLDRLENPMTLGKTNLLLFELPSSGDVRILPDAVRWIKKRGLVPVLAHPERFFAGKRQQSVVEFVQRCFNRLSPNRNAVDLLPSDLLEAMNLGCLLQADLGSFNGVYGPNAKRLAMSFQKQEMYACVGSDGHNPRHAQRILTDNVWLTEQAPEVRRALSCGAGAGLKGVV